MTNGKDKAAGAGNGNGIPSDPEALAPAVEEALRVRAATDGRRLAAALGPVMGAALRRAVYELFRSAIRAVNRFLLFNVTWRGLKWRAEALWSGRPFREVVREHTLVSPMRQVLLIHRRTGLLLAEAHRQDAASPDGDMVSSMLTAIQDFVQDSFRSRWTQLQTVRFGDMDLCIEQRTGVVLAGIVDGDVNVPVRQAFRRTLDRVERELRGEIAAFDGDTGPFARAAPHLEACLRTQYPAEEKVLPLTWAVTALPVLALLGGAVFMLFEGLAWRDTVALLEAEPGIVVLESGWSRGGFHVKGLRDPLAPDPAVLIAESGVRIPVRAEWKAYQAAMPDMMLRRARGLLDPPASVTLEIEGDVLRLRGEAPASWLERARLVAAALGGVQEIDLSRVAEAYGELDRQWARAVRQLRQTPGLVVLEAGRDNGRYRIEGLRDPGAPDPEAILAAMDVDPDRVSGRWELYESAEAPFVLERARRVLVPPPSVSLRLEGGTLAASGRAPHAWVRRAALLAPGLRGVTDFDMTALQDAEREEYDALRSRIEALLFRVFPGTGDPLPGQVNRMERLVADVRRLAILAEMLERPFTVEVRGHAPATGSEDSDTAVSLVLARRFLELLRRRNIDPSVFTARGAGAELPEGAEVRTAVHEGWVSFRVAAPFEG
ncbi:MAG: hypothetical protein JW951_10105 [Lentisphaerae bacterium]|nr:hypothetical protein [Lentisphaerota bacterium]